MAPISHTEFLLEQDKSDYKAWGQKDFELPRYTIGEIHIGI